MSDERPQRPTTNDRDAWKAYWAAQGMSWRTEPEIDAERQRYLDKRRAVKPDIAKGIYPFRDANGGIHLARADVEWLLAAHDSGGLRGPVDARDERQREREGLDMRGANLQGVHLRGLPLAHLHAGLAIEEWSSIPRAHRTQAWEAAAVHLEDADLVGAHLEGAVLTAVHMEGAVLQLGLEGGRRRAVHLERADLRGAHLEGADLRVAYLEGAILRSAHLEGRRLNPDELGRVRQRVPRFPEILPPANLQRAFFDASTTLDDITLGTQELGFVWLADVRWGNANLAVVQWGEPLGRGRGRRGTVVLGEERHARPRRAAAPES
jgi:uncharacterized protein YjbI with pentapeptide repeats